VSGNGLFINIEQRCAEFDKVLDQLEAARQGDGTYGPVEYAAAVALAGKFVEECWDFLPHRRQKAYAARLVFMQSGRRPAV
jgi:hypothetical protein